MVKRNNDYAVNIILNFVSEPKRFISDNMTSVCDMWDSLINVYKENNHVNTGVTYTNY
jgi:hypothetical protein